MLGQRRSYDDGNLCTIRYVGTVQGTSGEWLGVEWDNPTRGKHSGQHNGVRYFTCKSNHPTAGSFVRPSRPADKPRGFLEALREKYSSEFLEQERVRQQQGHENGFAYGKDPLQDSIEISGKVVEKVGFDKIRQKLAELQELKIVLLDGLRVAGILADDGDSESAEREKACREIEETCPKITELDLSRSLLIRWKDVNDICRRLGRLKVLKLNGNRLGPVEDGLTFDGITELHLNETLFSWDEASQLASQFPALTTLSISMNQIQTIATPISESIKSLTLEYNEIDSLDSIKQLAALPKLERLALRGNCIDAVDRSSTANDTVRFSPSVKSVDLSNNKINSWSFINALSTVFPGLQSLRVSGNPLYEQPVASSAITNMPERPMTVDEAYMLTLARLGSAQVLNYGKITPQDRNNGELYYLSLIGKELSLSPEDSADKILSAHPRYQELCKTYGEPLIKRADKTGSGTVNPRSVAARLVKMVFHLPSSTTEHSVKEKEIPVSFDTYQVKATVSRLFNLPPFGFRLVWETDELDPVNQDNLDEDWDSEDETGPGDAETANNSTKFVKREVELMDTTRDIGFWFQDIGEANIRVEL